MLMEVKVPPIVWVLGEWCVGGATGGAMIGGGGGGYHEWWLVWWGSIVWYSTILWVVRIGPICGYLLSMWVSMAHGPSQPIDNM
jgi:hypothetical protein